MGKTYKKRLGKDNNSWKGGRCISSSGYVYVYLPEHPHCTEKGYFLEHRLLMEKYIGRILLPTEIVHHTNGNILDNRIENLMLYSDAGKHMKYHYQFKRIGYRNRFLKEK